MPDSADENRFLRSLGSTHLGIAVAQGHHYANWNIGEPSGDGKHAALIVGTQWNKRWNGKWNDQPSNLKHSFPTTCYTFKG